MGQRRGAPGAAGARPRGAGSEDAGATGRPAGGAPRKEATKVQVTVEASVGAVAPADWDALVPGDDPFLEHAFLSGLEETGCVGEGTGWTPRPLVARRDGRVVGAVPLYEKDHSFGEFIFDWGWARAAAQAGLAYYPKLVAAVPFTPVTGRRLLGDEAGVARALEAGLGEAAGALRAHSVHVLFCTGDEKARLSATGFTPRLTDQLHWHNDAGWATFDDYLGAMRHSARKQVRRERRIARSHGLELELVPGPELDGAGWDALYRLYRDTVARKGGMAYLNRAFFEHLRSRLGHRVQVAVARRGSRVVAASLLFHKGEVLYGRYWGSFEPLDALHFELCYYLPIEWALEHGVTRFEAGAQGEHKLARGLLPAPIHSAHRLLHPGLAAAVAESLEWEREAVEDEMRLLAEHGPFRRDG